MNRESLATQSVPIVIYT